MQLLFTTTRARVIVIIVNWNSSFICGISRYRAADTRYLLIAQYLQRTCVYVRCFQNRKRTRERALKTNISVIRASGSERRFDGNAARQARLVLVKPIRNRFTLRIMYTYARWALSMTRLWPIGNWPWIISAATILSL